MLEFEKGSHESEQEFAKRVLERTGISLEDMPEAPAEDLLGSHIFAKRDNVYVVATGEPTRKDEETGEEYWEDPSAFRKVIL